MNVSRFGSSKQCWSSPSVHQTYIVMATPHHCAGQVVSCGTSDHPGLAARYDDPYGAVVDYSSEVEGRILKAIGEFEFV